MTYYMVYGIVYDIRNYIQIITICCIQLKKRYKKISGHSPWKLAISVTIWNIIKESQVVVLGKWKYLSRSKKQ
jgi:hypothetical protein